MYMLSGVYRTLALVLILFCSDIEYRATSEAATKIKQTVSQIRNDLRNRVGNRTRNQSNRTTQTFNPDPLSVRFLVFGDWGGIPFYPYSTVIQRRTAKKMAQFASRREVQFILALGDNFYFTGVRDVGDRRFQRTFEEIYNEGSMRIPWYVIAGNHDHDGNVSAQIAYSKISNRWIFPDYYYSRSFEIPGTDGDILDVFMLDTVLICGKTAGNEDDQPIPQTRSKNYSKQFRWLIAELEKSKAKYILVAGHYPIYSACSHGTTDCLVSEMVPILQKYRVNAYLAGHDHDLQHIRPDLGPGNWTVEYFVSGATNFINPSLIHKRTLPKDSLKFAWASLFSYGGFAYMEVTRHRMLMQMYSTAGILLHEHSMPPRF
ncbi:tartrate-resistant acid phosphatase type 5-like [Tropilaelaps mercedesae]|uniref:Tartrate-resistant acid phosphatase type 5 n=1 Tax=Tropilaelaps mercedesae TaxID=418985 RepID=A0A1V9XSI0_9ACAR|nr:tartrate-resistant acid phosphatase type 5-like [Tropilaelaps mercedesae]